MKDGSALGLEASRTPSSRRSRSPRGSLAPCDAQWIARIDDEQVDPRRRRGGDAAKPGGKRRHGSARPLRADGSTSGGNANDEGGAHERLVRRAPPLFSEP